MRVYRLCKKTDWSIFSEKLVQLDFRLKLVLYLKLKSNLMFRPSTKIYLLYLQFNFQHFLKIFLVLQWHVFWHAFNIINVLFTNCGCSCYLWRRQHFFCINNNATLSIQKNTVFLTFFMKWIVHVNMSLLISNHLKGIRYSSKGR